VPFSFNSDAWKWKANANANTQQFRLMATFLSDPRPKISQKKKGQKRKAPDHKLIFLFVQPGRRFSPLPLERIARFVPLAPLFAFFWGILPSS
jgi:hypothetical protein